MQRRICVQSSSLVKTWHYNCQWKRAKVLLETTTKMSYWKELKKKYHKKLRPVTCFKHVWLLHDNAPNHTSANVTIFFFFFAKREDNSFSTPYLFTIPCPLWLLSFSRLKIFLAGLRYQSKEKPGSAVYQYLTSIPKFANLDASGSGLIS